MKWVVAYLLFPFVAAVFGVVSGLFDEEDEF